MSSLSSRKKNRKFTFGACETLLRSSTTQCISAIHALLPDVECHREVNDSQPRARKQSTEEAASRLVLRKCSSPRLFCVLLLLLATIHGLYPLGWSVYYGSTRPDGLNTISVLVVNVAYVVVGESVCQSQPFWADRTRTSESRHRLYTPFCGIGAKLV